MGVIDLLLNLIFPPKCIFCKTVLPVTSELALCDGCRKKLSLRGDKVCWKCGSPMDILTGNETCFECRNGTRFFYRARAPFLYEGPVKDLILRFKFHQFMPAADVLGAFMAKTALEIEEKDPIDLITFVPLSKNRLRERGYNQAELLAKSVAKHFPRKAEVRPVLEKICENEVQSHLGHDRRIENVRGVFGLSDEIAVVDKAVLLVDDVFTTGATANECARVLRVSGANLVYVVTAAVSDFEKY